MNVQSLLRALATAGLVFVFLLGSGGASSSTYAHAAAAPVVAAPNSGSAPDALALAQTEVPSPSVNPAAAAQTAQPPRTLRAYWHVFIAFAATWLLLFGYVISIGRRWSRLEREVRALSME